MNFLSCNFVYFRYLETENLNIELYVSNGADAIKIANAEVALKDLID